MYHRKIRRKKLLKSLWFRVLSTKYFGWSLIRDHLQISLLILSEFKRINQFLFPLKLPENHRFSDDFMGNRSYIFNSLNIRSKIWRWSLSDDKYFYTPNQFIIKRKLFDSRLVSFHDLGRKIWLSSNKRHDSFVFVSIAFRIMVSSREI